MRMYGITLHADGRVLGLSTGDPQKNNLPCQWFETEPERDGVFAGLDEASRYDFDTGMWTQDASAVRAGAQRLIRMKVNEAVETELAGWAYGESLSWDQQRAEARRVLAGETLGDDALLPGLAEDKSEPLADYAQSVIDYAVQYQVLMRAVIDARRVADEIGADETLTDASAIEAARDAALASFASRIGA